jgi:hypothetical protein
MTEKTTTTTKAAAPKKIATQDAPRLPNLTVMLSTTIKQKLDEVKSLSSINPTYLKEKTKLEIKAERKPLVDFDMVREDVNLLSASGLPLHSTTLIVSNCAGLGKVINRAVPAFAKLGIQLLAISWDASEGVVGIEPIQPVTGYDLPYLAVILHRLAIRGCQSISGTQHPFTVFDLQQACGITFEAKQGIESAVEIENWFTMRELSVLEEAKELKKLEMDAKKTATSEKVAKARSAAAENKANRKKTSKVDSLADLHPEDGILGFPVVDNDPEVETDDPLGIGPAVTKPAKPAPKKAAPKPSAKTAKLAKIGS